MVEPVRICVDRMSGDEIDVDVERLSPEVRGAFEAVAEGSTSISAAPANGNGEHRRVGEFSAKRTEAALSRRSQVFKRRSCLARKTRAFGKTQDIGRVFPGVSGAARDRFKVAHMTTTPNEAAPGELSRPSERWPALERLLHDPAQACPSNTLHDGAQQRCVDEAPVIRDHHYRPGRSRKIRKG